MAETVLVVDDEDGVRRTFQEWLDTEPDVQVFAVADAEAALRLAADVRIDLAILDWNLGSGLDGLSLLEDLVVFQPDLVAILVTGFANQATPLDALRMGVRDYLDKNQSLTRDVFLAAVRKQLQRIIPLKRQRELTAQLEEFRTTLVQVLPLVQSSAALNDPVPVERGVGSVLRFLLTCAGAQDGRILVWPKPAEANAPGYAYQPDGSRETITSVPLRNTLAASVLSVQEPLFLTEFDRNSLGAVTLLPCEQQRTALLIAPLPLGNGVPMVVELYDTAPLTGGQSALFRYGLDLAAELLRVGFAERHTQNLVFDAVDAALKASDKMSQSLTAPEQVPAVPLKDTVLAKLKTGLTRDHGDLADADMSLPLLEAVRELTTRHGPVAITHCTRLIHQVHRMLDEIQGSDA
jgi:DNA-binding NarL/FixJ family response regulator